MNWRRGLWRSWALLTVLWLTLVCIYGCASSHSRARRWASSI